MVVKLIVVALAQAPVMVIAKEVQAVTGEVFLVRLVEQVALVWDVAVLVREIVLIPAKELVGEDAEVQIALLKAMILAILALGIVRAV